MGTGNLQAAYAPFVACLLAGGFEAPADGEWSAELVAAHVALNNDLIAETAEKVTAGQEVAYDNEGAVDESALTRHVESVGGLTGLAADVERTAGRLESAREALGEELAGTLVHVVIHDGGKTVVDGPVPIGAFIDGNAGFHLDRHLDQLKALQPPRVAGAPAEFDSYELVLLMRVPEPPRLGEAEGELLQGQHLGYFANMQDLGYMTVVGPIREDEEIAGVCAYRVGSLKKARKLAEDDPAIRAGQFTVRVMQWYTAKGAMSFPVTSVNRES